MFTFDVVVKHFFERKYFITILTGILEFDAFPMNLHEMAPILKGKYYEILRHDKIMYSLFMSLLE